MGAYRTKRLSSACTRGRADRRATGAASGTLLAHGRVGLEAMNIEGVHRRIAACTSCPRMQPWQKFDTHGNVGAAWVIVGDGLPP